MTPKEALKIVVSKMQPTLPTLVSTQDLRESRETLEAIFILRDLIEGPTVALQDQEVMKRVANILFRLQPTWAFTGDLFTTLDTIERSLEDRGRKTQTPKREERER